MALLVVLRVCRWNGDEVMPAPRRATVGGRSLVCPYSPVGLESFSMAKNKKKADSVFLVCKETGDRNYTVRRKPGGEKLSLKKYSPRLRKHTEHAEKKK